jgi:acyl-CoA thioester hydrolase
MPRDSFRFSHSLRVRWAELDPQGVVFNANYLTYFDVGVTEYWRDVGCVYPGAFFAQGVDTFLVKATVEYKVPARFDDEIAVRARVRRIGRTSITFFLSIERGAELLAYGELHYVFTSLADRKPAPVPEVVRRAVLDYEHSPVETSPAK